MAAEDAKLSGLVLKKTKLGESDLVISLLLSDGSERSVIAKGARKPRNAGSARLELFNGVQVCAASSRGLGIVKESKLVQNRQRLQSDPLLFACASVMAEAVHGCIQPELEVGNLFDMTSAALDAVQEAGDKALPAIVAAYIFKLSALLGMRPSFLECAVCASPIDPQDVRFSYADGGALCPDSAHLMDSVKVDARTLVLSHELMMSRFQDMLDAEDPASWDALGLAEAWFIANAGGRLRSMSSFKSICSVCLGGSSSI